jgi:hypothetical protein
MNKKYKFIGSLVSFILTGWLAFSLPLTTVLAGDPAASANRPLAAWPPATPVNLTLTVSETANITRTDEVVRSGVPLPRSLNVTSTSNLAVVDGTNTLVPAEFQVLARWHAGINNAAAPIQWLLVTFPATVGANSSATYRLITDGSAGSNPAPATPLTLSQVGNQVTINTGAARFVIGGSASTLFDEIRLASNTRLVSGSTLTATVNSTNYTHPTLRNVRIEHSGPLSAVVIVEGLYNMPATGGGQLSTLRRYVFTAGSPTAIVRQVVNWEGDLCGDGSNGYDLTCDNGSGTVVNGLLLNRVRNTLTLDNLAAPLAVTAIGDFDLAALTGTANAGQSASVRQQRRASRNAALAFDVSVPGVPSGNGQKADGGVLAVSNANGALAIALNHMHRYEPQALRLLSDGRLAIDIVDNGTWLGQRQGLFATLAVSALPSNPSRADLNRLVWAPLNHSLHAWPAPEWFAASQAVDEFPVGTLPAAVADYDTLVPAVLDKTMQDIESRGVGGLTTFGLYPRYWDYPLYADELDCGDDPTPANDWDDAYWCGAWTDYHNTVAAAPIWAMRSGEVEWLDEIAFPGALRMLHTQIMQCSPTDDYFYCGQSPAGYGGYRQDFNSSHAYFDNLFLYYWLTGDSTVVDTLERGASSMRNYLCFRRPANPCLPNDLPADEWAQLTGRVASQWFAAFRFVGLASDDASYLDDYTSGLARAFTQYYVQVQQNGTNYGFLLSSADPVNGPGMDSTDQLWMISLYDMNNLYHLQMDTNDAPFGNPAIPPSQIIAAWARTLTTFGSTVSGNGTPGGNWPNALFFTWSGSRIGGTLISVSENTGGDDPYLWDTGKATLVAVLMRAADQTGNAGLRQMGEAMTQYSLDSAQDNLSPLSKLQGEYLARLHAAVARYGTGGNPGSTATPTQTSTPGPSPTPTSTPSAWLYLPIILCPLGQ